VRDIEELRDVWWRLEVRDALILVSAIEGRVAAIKPNIAFFEQYGLPGLSAFPRLCDAARERSIPVIADAKLGDIGSTAAAYSAASLCGVSVGSRTMRAFHCDALTINPFLGFDTLEPFLKDAQECGEGPFILVQTSNPGAKALQGLRAEGVSVSEHVARWVAENAQKLQGACGWSGVGAVVGASYPDEARKLREVMPRSIFLIPRLGA
jgi:orotidine-5'-phosphate decarboxylase